jgi:hypothetical protein
MPVRDKRLALCRDGMWWARNTLGMAFEPQAAALSDAAWQHKLSIGRLW